MAIETTVPDIGSHSLSGIHPLDPLTGDEIEGCSSIVLASEYASESLRFVMISLAEPPKPADLDFDLVPVPPRKAFVVAYDGSAKMIYESIVNLADGVVESWTPVPGR